MKKDELLEQYMAMPYKIVLSPEESGGYFAEVKELKGCMTQGDTIEEVMKNIKEAKELWLKIAIDEGIKIPVPEVLDEYNGRFLIKIPKSLHRKLAKLADDEDVSVNELIVYILSRNVGVMQHKKRLHKS